MSAKSRKPSIDRLDPARPFTASILRRAGEIADKYRVILEPNDELGFIGSAIEMPTVFADGATPDRCVKATRQALTIAVATMLEAGKRPPVAKGRRAFQINVRLTAEEKLALEEAAANLGFRGISEFVRAAALNRLGAA